MKTVPIPRWSGVKSEWLTKDKIWEEWLVRGLARCKGISKASKLMPEADLRHMVARWRNEFSNPFDIDGKIPSTIILKKGKADEQDFSNFNFFFNQSQITLCKPYFLRASRRLQQFSRLAWTAFKKTSNLTCVPWWRDAHRHERNSRLRHLNSLPRKSIKPIIDITLFTIYFSPRNRACNKNYRGVYHTINHFINASNRRFSYSRLLTHDCGCVFEI